MTDRSQRAAPQTDQIEAGDKLATCGDWLIAIEIWQRAVAHDPRLRRRVQQRLTWFLHETDPRGPQSSIKPTVCIWASVGAALLGVGCISIAGTPGEPVANVLAATAWVMFTMSAVLAIVAARGNTTRDFDDLLQRARDNARRLANIQHDEECDHVRVTNSQT
jgi:hypothetical protein